MRLPAGGNTIQANVHALTNRSNLTLPELLLFRAAASRRHKEGWFSHAGWGCRRRGWRFRHATEADDRSLSRRQGRRLRLLAAFRPHQFSPDMVLPMTPHAPAGMTFACAGEADGGYSFGVAACVAES